MTHRVYKSESVTALLTAQKRRPHGRQRNAKRYWKIRAVNIVHPGAFLSDTQGSRSAGHLRTMRPR